MTAFADAFPEYAFKSERAQVALDAFAEGENVSAALAEFDAKQQEQKQP